MGSGPSQIIIHNKTDSVHVCGSPSGSAGWPYKTHRISPVLLSEHHSLKEKLGMIIESNEIVTAHVLPASPEFLQEKPPNIIVQFARRERRSEVIQRRRQLKNTGITILEDLTTSNVKLMNPVRNHPRIKNTWSSNGKIFGLTHNNKKSVLTYMMI